MKFATIGIGGVVMLLFMTSTTRAETLIPPELQFEVVQAPGYQSPSSMCPMGQNTGGNNGGAIDHAAHHKVAGVSEIKAVKLDAAETTKVVQEIDDSQNKVNELLKQLE